MSAMIPRQRRRAEIPNFSKQADFWHAPCAASTFGRGLQTFVFTQQLLVGLAPCGIERDATDRTHLLTLRFIKMPDAFSAFVRIDFVDLRPHVNRFVRALGLADVAVNAIISDHQCHKNSAFYSCRRVAHRPAMVYPSCRQATP